MKKKLSRHLSFMLCLIMVCSVIMGTSQMQAKAEGETDSKVITQVDLEITEGAKISINNLKAGDVPEKIAKVPNGDAGKYIVAGEMWELMKVDTSADDSVEKWWPRSGSESDECIITEFEDGRSYRYQISLKVAADSGYTFAQDVKVSINGTALDEVGSFVNKDGKGGMFISKPFTVGNNNNGGGDISPTYTVDFGTGSWKIGETTVTADKTGQQTLSDFDVITLTNFNAATMEVKVSATDGFGTMLTVTDNKTSLSAKTNDGGLPSAMTFSVEPKTSGGNGEGGNGEGGNGEGGSNVKVPKTITVSVTEGESYLDTLNNDYLRIDGKNVQNGSVTVEQAATHTIAVLPQFGYTISAVINGETVNGTEKDGWMTYTVDEADSYSIAIRQAGSNVYTVAWDYVGNFGDDALVSNGTVKIISATMPDGTDGINGVNDQSEKGGHVAIRPGSTVTVEIKPDYGYQFMEGSLNEQKIVAGTEVSKFTFIMPETNLHLSALFTKTDDIIDTDSKQVSSGSIANGAAVVDSGNLKLEIGDLTEEQKTAVDATMKEKAGDDEIQLYLEMDLYNVINKGTKNDAWENKLTELDGDLSVTLELSDELKGKDGTFYVIREHDEADGTKSYTKIQATYNKETGTITFATNKFSTYALVYADAQKNSGTGNAGSGDSGSSNTGSSDAGSGNTGNSNTTASSTPDGGNTSGQAESPKTADTNASFWWFVLAMVSGAGMIYFGKRKRSCK